MMEHYSRAALKLLLPILIAVFSIFVAYRTVDKSAYSENVVSSVDESRDTVLKLAASATAASVAITVLPGDVATPVAEELAELSKGFLLVLCALYLEKFIAAVSGSLVFLWLIPGACAIYLFAVLARKKELEKVSFKIGILAAALMLVVPASVKISGMIEKTYNESINTTIESAQNSAELIQEGVGARDDEDAGKGLAKIFKNLQNSGDRIANGTSQLIDYFEKLLTRFVESVAIMIVMSCVIPILVILFFIWLIKTLFQFDTVVGMKQLEKHLLKKLGGDNDEREA